MEIEIKLRVGSADAGRELLARVGATPVAERRFEVNVLYDRRDDPLALAGRMLRLRRCGGTSLLTYKAPVQGTHRHKVREERETEVRDPEALEAILHGLGLDAAWRYEKYRTLFDLEGARVCLDETPLGCFLELEGAPEAIDRAAARLGFAERAYVRATYRELQEAAAGRSDVGDLVFTKSDVKPPAG